MKNRFILILIACQGILFLSCENNIEEELQEIKECDPNISFSKVIKPIIDNNCLQCHNGNQFPDLRTYESIRINASKIKEETQSRRMPISSSLTTTEIEAIACWVDSGALNN